MGFLSKIGKGLKKVAKSVGKTVGKAAQFAAPIVSIIPGIGTAVGAGLSMVGGLLGPKEKAPKQVTHGAVGPSIKLMQPTTPASTASGATPALSGAMPLALAALAFLLFKG